MEVLLVRVVSLGGIEASPDALRDGVGSFALDSGSVEDPRAIGERVLSVNLAAFGG